MKKIAALLLTLLLVTGFSVAAHGADSHAGDSGVGAVSDTPNAGKTAGPPDEKGEKPEDVGVNQTGPDARSKGLQKAITKVPGDVANFVLSPIQEFDPGKALGNALKGVGELLGMQDQEMNRTMNGSENTTIN